MWDSITLVSVDTLAEVICSWRYVNIAPAAAAAVADSLHRQHTAQAVEAYITVHHRTLCTRVFVIFL